VLLLAVAAAGGVYAVRLTFATSQPASGSVLAGPTASALPFTSGFAPDPRYGWLTATQPGSVSSVALVDEAGVQLSDRIDGVTLALTSPNGRYVALWSTTPQGTSELRFLDAVLRPVTIGGVSFATDEHLTERGLAWANDSSAVVLATGNLARTRENQNAPVRTTVRTVDRETGAATTILTTDLAGFSVFGWNRNARSIAMLVSPPGASRGAPRSSYATLEDHPGASLQLKTTNDFPVTADYSARYVAAVGDCSSGPPCRAVFVHDAQTYQTIAETTLVSQGGWGVMFRPRSADLLVHVQRGSDMTGATFAVELWADLGRGPKRELASMHVTANGPSLTIPGWWSRADGSAVALLQRLGDGTWSGDLVDTKTLARISITTRQPVTPVVLDAKLEAAPAIRTPQPTPVRYLVRTAEDVLRGVVTDPFVTGAQPGTSARLDPSSFGMPLYVHALRARDRDLWLVPRRQGASTVAVYAVMVDADSYGSAGIAGFWTGDPSGAGIAIPPVTEARARELGASAGVAVAAADLVWMTVAPIEGFLCNELHPMWRLAARDGRIVYITGDGDAKTAAEVELLRS